MAGETRKGWCRRAGSTSPRAVQCARPSRPRLCFLVGMTAAALALRIALLSATLTKTIYPFDHDDFVRWGIQATDRGMLTLYSAPPARHQMQVFDGNRWVKVERSLDRICNYPPLSAYLFWISGMVHKAADPERLINTTASHAIYSFWSIVGDLLVAAGSAAIVALFRPKSRAALTYALVLMLPPLWWDSVIWGQMDSVLLAPAVWMLYCMLQRRWLMAGVLWGVALGLKTQAVLFVPLWGLAMLVGQPRRGPWMGLAMMCVSVSIIALPFTLTGEWAVDGPDWVRASYSENLFASTYSHLTTLTAFNIWYLDLLLSDSLDAHATWLSIEKGTWGQAFLALGLLGSFVLAVWRWYGDRRALLFFAPASLVLFMMLPTSVHERYLILVLPFLGVASAVSSRLLGALSLLVVVLLAQISWPLWLGSVRGTWTEIEASVEEQYVAQLALAAQDPSRQVPPRSVWLEAARERYVRLRDRTAGREWLLTILALGATVLAFFDFVAMPLQAEAPCAAERTDRGA